MIDTRNILVFACCPQPGRLVAGLAVVAALLTASAPTPADTTPPPARPPAASSSCFSWERFQGKSEAWCLGKEGRDAAENILSHRSPRGSWPKNVNTSAAPFLGDTKKFSGTFDNAAPAGKLRFLVRAYRASGDDRCKAAFLKGLNHIFQAQYPSGGWPETYPPDAT